MIDFEQWEGFEGRIWKEEVNVRDFIQKNYTPYDGDESFLAGPTEATNQLWGALQKLQKEERAKGGVGMIIEEYTGVDDIDSIPSIHNLRIAREYHVPEMEKLTDAVHMYDCKIAAQLHHAGATSNPALTGRPNLAPSAVPIAPGKLVPQEMTKDDIQRIQQKFIDAAVCSGWRRPSTRSSSCRIKSRSAM